MGDLVGSDRPAPVSTYRLQLHDKFGFAQAARVGDYLAGLGITHVYLSPVLQAAPGSQHGYDVVDHSQISTGLGGEKAFRAMAASLREHGLGVIVDVVPNHMAIPVPESLNRQLWSVLSEGHRSPYAHWFDIDWDRQRGRFLLPVLGAPLEESLADLKPDTVDDQPVLRYFDHLLPVRAGTERLPLPDLLAVQHYRLAHWRAASTELNWRRFFDITSLIAVRVEDPEVFDATHRVLLGLVADGTVDGLRVDHPDGLADPRGYLRRLAEATGGAWVVTEKILSGTEELPPDWPCAGTTGYDTAAAVAGLFTDPAGAEPLTATYVDFTGAPASFGPVAEAAKRQVATEIFATEVTHLVGLLTSAGVRELHGVSGEDLGAVVTGLLTGFGVYRAYVIRGERPSDAAVTAVYAATAAAGRDLPPRLHGVLSTVRDLLLGASRDRADPERLAELVLAFQQTCGPVMAKGVEDTAFYRWSRLSSLNEVGGDPGRFGAPPQEFHEFAARLTRDWPATMTTLSTHDTKRQEDVRARLAALAERPGEWAAEVTRWHDRAAALTSGRAPEPDTEYLLWQTLAGAWPVTAARLSEYLRKAMREAKTATSWLGPDETYESAVLAFAGAALRDHVLRDWIGNFVASLAPAARATTLSAKLVQLTMPGVADVYQGCELTGYALVDPDNRRPVDFERRRRLLASQDTRPPGRPIAASEHSPDRLDQEKLLVTSAALRLRRAHPDWFAGSYEPLAAEGQAAGHAVAFSRGGKVVTVATRLPAGLAAAGGWAATALPLPEGRWRDVFTGATYDAGAPLMSELTKRFPVALLVPEGTSPR
jgi:(1->4)-alpha-D-glucan 1-alpha-D-glucosylmutase